MPEGVEVKIITKQLSKALLGKSLTSIEIIGGRFVNSPPKFLAEIQQALPLNILQIACKGKFLYWILSKNQELGIRDDLGFTGFSEKPLRQFPNWYIYNTLGMTGKWSWTANKFSCLKLTIGDKDLYFEDMRRFGTINFERSDLRDNPLRNKLQQLGPDMLSCPPKDTEFLSLMREQNKKNICQVLMNQKIISGIGNYIKSEALFRSGINPNNLILDLDQDQLKQLRLAIIDVMTESYNQQGATLRDYQHLEGSGKFADFFRVYSKKTCPKGHAITSAETPDKRTSWFCLTCQPIRKI